MLTEKLPDYHFVVIGSGHGPRTTEREINTRTHRLSSIVGGQADNRGHTGKLVEDLDIPGIGDITTRMSNHYLDPYDQDTYDFRWEGAMSYRGHRPVNEMLAMHIKRLGVVAGIKKFEQSQVGYRGRTIPITEKRLFLEIHYANGDKKQGEGYIDDHKITDPPIKEVKVLPEKLKTNPEALDTIKAGDAIVLAPGTVRTNELIYQHPGVPEAIKHVQNHRDAIVFCLVNSFNHPDSYGWKASRHLQNFAMFGINIDHAIVADIQHPIPPQYHEEGYQQVEADLDECLNYARRVHLMPVTHLEEYGNRQVVKHDGEKVVDFMYSTLLSRYQIASKLLAFRPGTIPA